MTSEMHFRNARKLCFRRCISENAFFLKKNYLISEVHFRKHHFGNELPKYCAFCRFSKTAPSPNSFSLNQLNTQPLFKFFAKIKCKIKEHSQVFFQTHHQTLIGKFYIVFSSFRSI